MITREYCKCGALFTWFFILIGVAALLTGEGLLLENNSWPQNLSLFQPQERLPVALLQEAPPGSWQTTEPGASATISNTEVFTVYLAFISGTSPFPSLQNPDFEVVPDNAWETTSSNFGNALIIAQPELPEPITAHSPVRVVWLGGAPNERGRLAQRVLIGEEHGLAKLRFWYWIASAESNCAADTAAVSINDVVKWSPNLCRVENTNGWRAACIDVDGYGGQTVSVAFTVSLDTSENSNFFVDDVQFARSCDP